MSAASAKSRLDDAEVVNIWPAPDMSVLGGGRRPPVPMTGELFGSLWGMVQDFAEGAGSAPDYPAISLLSSAASIIGGKRRIQPYVDVPQWREPAILWVAGVGDPSSNKSSGLESVMEGPFKRLEDEYSEAHKSALRDFATEKERAKAERAQWQDAVNKAVKAGGDTPDIPLVAIEPEEPQRRRFVVKDITPEKMAEILSGNPSGTLHYRDELAGWLASFDRYAPGGRQFWLEAYGGRPFVIDRKSHPVPLAIKFTGVSVAGGIQPDKMAELIAGADDGLVARFLLAWPAPKPFQRPKRCGDIRRLENIYRRLDSLGWAQSEVGKDAPVVLTLTSEAADFFDAWAIENDRDLDDTGSLYKNFCGKLKGVVLRIALVIELLHWADQGGDEPREVSSRTLLLAADFVEEYAKPMALRVYGDAAVPQCERDAAVIAKHIVNAKIRKFNARTLRRAAGYPGTKNPEMQAAALDQLVQACWLRPAPSRVGERAGRQTLDFIVNPGVFNDG